MYTFAISALTAYTMTLAIACALAWEWLRQTPSWFYLAAAMVLAPTAAVWLAADLINRLRPRRSFDHRARSSPGNALAGVATAATCLAIAAITLPFVNDDRLDPAILCAASFLSATLVVLALPRPRPAHCITCGYDLQGSPHAQCPECGLFHTT